MALKNTMPLSKNKGTADSTIYVENRASIFYEYRRMPKRNPMSTLFGRRLREARLRAGIAQDKLGVAIGLDEGSSSARMSRYECGIHEPPFLIIERLAQALHVPTAYFFCDDDTLAGIMLLSAAMPESERKAVLDYLIELNKKLHGNESP